MNKVIEILSKEDLDVLFRFGEQGRITKSTDIDTFGYGYIWERDYDEKLHCLKDKRFDIVKIYFDGSWKDTEEVLRSIL